MFTETKQLCLPNCQEYVAVYKEFNVKRHYQSKHADDKLSWSDRAEKVKQPLAVLAS